MGKHEQELLLQSNELSSTYSSFKTLLLQMREHINNREYGLVISDDTSGRVPALVLHRAINNIYLAKGENPIGFMGLQGSEEDWHIPFIRNRYKKNHQKRKLENGSKSLIVTEFIGDGTHIGNFRLALEPEGVIFDVATLSARKTQEFYHEIDVLTPEQKLFNAQSPQSFTDNTVYSGLNPKKFDNEKFIGVKKRRIIHEDKRKTARLVLTHSQRLASILADEFLQVE